MKVFFPSRNSMVISKDREKLMRFCDKEEFFAKLPSQEYYVFVLGNVEVVSNGDCPVSNAKVVNIIEEEGKCFVVPIASQAYELFEWVSKEQTLAQDYMV